MNDLVSSIGEALPEGVHMQEETDPLNGCRVIRCRTGRKISRANPAVVFYISDEAREDYERAKPRYRESARDAIREIAENVWSTRTSLNYEPEVRGVRVRVTSSQLGLSG